jgi:threonine synthase
MTYQGLIHRYGQYLDLPAYTKNISLLEGNTPLIPMPRLSTELGCELFIKFEGLNPTGSFKDRGMTAAISEAVGRGAQTVICASTGNTAASAAAYAARAGLRSIVLIPEGKVAVGKLAGAIAYGAEVIQIQGSFDDALTLVVEITQKTPIAWSIRLIHSASRGRRQAHLKFVMTSVPRLIGYACLLVMLGISHRIGLASNNIKKDCRKFWRAGCRSRSAGVGTSC